MDAHARGVVERGVESRGRWRHDATQAAPAARHGGFSVPHGNRERGAKEVFSAALPRQRDDARRLHKARLPWQQGRAARPRGCQKRGRLDRHRARRVSNRASPRPVGIHLPIPRRDARR